LKKVTFFVHIAVIQNVHWEFLQSQNNHTEPCGVLKCTVQSAWDSNGCPLLYLFLANDFM